MYCILSDKINGGYNLNKLTPEKYYLLLKLKQDRNYYSFKTLSSYNLEYYTITKDKHDYKIDVNYNKKRDFRKNKNFKEDI